MYLRQLVLLYHTPSYTPHIKAYRKKGATKERKKEQEVFRGSEKEGQIGSQT